MDSNLGYLRIEYKNNGNTIQLFNSNDLCSLLINGKIADQYKGLFALKFVLKGEVKENDKVIEVQARMGFLYMKLYYDNVLVVKKFMGLG
jgi:hypothetical protein